MDHTRVYWGRVFAASTSLLDSGCSWQWFKSWQTQGWTKPRGQNGSWPTRGGVWGYQGWDHCDTPRAVGVPSGSEMATFLRSDMGAKLSKISSFQSETSPKCNFWVRTSQNHSQPISSRKSKPNHQTKWSQPILPHLTFSFSLRPLTNFSGREVPIFADI